MATKSCHSNQSSYPIGTKKKKKKKKKKQYYSFPLPIDAILEIWQESASWLQRRCRSKMLTTTTEGLTDDGCLAILSWEQLPIDIQYLDLHIICRSTYSMSINIHTMYVDRHTICQLTYCMSIEIHQCIYADRHTVCQSTYYMSIEILYVDRLLCLTDTTSSPMSLRLR